MDDDRIPVSNREHRVGLKPDLRDTPAGSRVGLKPDLRDRQGERLVGLKADLRDPIGGSRVRVWDPFVRPFHWGLVGAFTIGWLTQEQDYWWHLVAGYTVLTLVVLRVLWGFLGPRYARFSDFVRGPAAVLGYLVRLGRGRAPRFIGHNPAGGAMILALLAAMLAVTISGVALDAAENLAGPLGDTTLFLYTDGIARIHLLATDLSPVLIALHLLGVLSASLAHRENLIVAMIVGTKRPQDARSSPEGD